MKQYAGNRDPRFVAIHRGGDLDLTTHRLLVAWAADCAEHVLPLFTEVHPTDTRPSHAIAIAREWASGNATIEQARQAAFGAHAAARESSNSAAIAVLEQQAMLWQPLTYADHELAFASP